MVLAVTQVINVEYACDGNIFTSTGRVLPEARVSE